MLFEIAIIQLFSKYMFVFAHLYMCNILYVSIEMLLSNNKFNVTVISIVKVLRIFIYQLWGVNVPSSALSDNGTTSPIGDCRVNRIGIFSRSGLSRCKNRIQDSSESRLEVPVNNKWYCV